MKLWLVFALGALAGFAATRLPRLAIHVFAHRTHAPDLAASTDAAALLHTQRAFRFLAKGPYDVVAPLFGADAERAWAPGWSPDFVWPAEPADREGMVFTTRHEQKKAVWINTELDLPAGRFQYVYVVPDTLVTRVSVHLSRRENGTDVAVEYQRTALNADASAAVQRMAEHDAAAGPEWDRQVNDYLNARAMRPR